MEVQRREWVSCNDRNHLDSFRAGNWNIAFLGRLKELLFADPRELDIDPTCYTYGTAPDTILNFGWSCWPLYAEINNNGRLNIKLSFDGIEASTRFETHAQAVGKIAATIDAGRVNPCNTSDQSMTIASADIGLSVDAGLLAYMEGIDFTRGKLLPILKAIYARD